MFKKYVEITVKSYAECVEITKQQKMLDPTCYAPSSFFGQKHLVKEDFELTDGMIACGQWHIPMQFIVEYDSWKIHKDGDLYIIYDGSRYFINAKNQTISLSPRDFWAISRIANFLDTKSEVEEYLNQLDSINGVSAKRLSTPNRVKLITEKVQKSRLSEESGDQIYYVIESLTKGGKFNE